MIVTRFQFVVLVCLIQSATATIIPFVFRHVEKLNETDLLFYKTSQNVRAIYYFKRDMPRLRAFFKELDKSAEYVAVYGSKIGIFDCSDNEVVQDCKKEKVERFIFTYRDGLELLRLELDTMFDVNSIMSNILQLILLREVPILQTLENRKTLEDNHRGQRDIIFSLQKAIGTYEHRIFMEVAFAYQDKFKFAVATDPAVAFELDMQAEDENALVFVLYCGDAEPDDKGCHSLRYKDKMDLVSLARFIRALTLPKTFDLPGDGYDMPFSYKDTHIMYMYYSRRSKTDVMEKSKRLIKAFHGLVAMVTVNIDEVDLSDLHGQNNVPAPALGLQLRREVSPVFMQETWQEDHIYNFIVTRLREGLDKDQSKSTVQKEQTTKDNPSKGDNHDEEDRPVNVEEVETQDDQVAEAVYRSGKLPMDLELVPALTRITFKLTVSDTSLLFVLFYLPFCSKSMAFLRAYGDASRQLELLPERPLARVNCHDWTDICSKNNITAYPTLTIYEHGKKLTDYRGPLDTDIVVQTVKLLYFDNPATMSSLTQVDSFIKGVYPLSAGSASNSSVLGLFDSPGTKDSAVFHEAAGMLRDKLMFGLCTGEAAKAVAERYGKTTPLILLFKRNDPYQIQVTYHGAMVTSELSEFLMDAAVPVLPQLNAVLFPQLYQRKQPFVVLFSDDQVTSHNAHALLRQVAMSRMFPDLLFCWMSVGGRESVGAQILFEYNKAVLPPALSFVQLQEAAVYNFKEEHMTFETVTGWLKTVQSKKIPPSTILPRGDWKPQSKGYDFLEIMAWEAKYGPDSPDPETTNAEEFGIGFDSDGNYIGEDEADYFGDSESEEDSEYDTDIRQELVQSRSSRLYHHSRDKKTSDHMTSVQTDKHVDSKDNSGKNDVGDKSQNEEKLNKKRASETKNEKSDEKFSTNQKVDSNRHTEL